MGLIILIFFGSATPQNAPDLEGPCPRDMVWVESGEFCIDRYEFPNRKGTLPVRGIDYRDAVALCLSRGKRVPTAQEFDLACQESGNGPYSYGAKHVPGKCGAGLGWPEGPMPSGSYPECKSFWGAFDINGNVWEWVQLSPRKTGFQFIAGGAWNTRDNRANCANKLRLMELVYSPNIGVRCVWEKQEK